MPDTTPTTDEAAEPADLRAKLDAADEQIANLTLRLADYENARKRTLRDIDAAKKYAAEPLARDLIPALDNLDRALDASKQAGDAGPLAAGVGATAAQLLDVLRRHGVTRIECGPGTPFDPNRHQAVSQQPSDTVAAGQVVQVLQHGFVIHDRVLRPASVIIAQG